MIARHKLEAMLSTPASPLARVLAFDTATEQLAVGLQSPDGPICTLVPGGAMASATLLPQVNAMLARAGLTYADLDCIAFGRGPGAFTGLRTACAVAQGLGFGLDKPVLPIDSLLIVAEDAIAQVAPGAAAFDIGVAMDARMGEVYAASYRWCGKRWQALAAPALLTPSALMEAWSGLALDAVAGSALGVFGDRLRVPTGAVRLTREADRAGALLRLAVRGAQAGDGVDAAAALPLYLRDKVAQTTAERQAVLRERVEGAA
jgi:tRNA threonylcarbamoyladenosine biosynthesis protein TsaB